MTKKVAAKREKSVQEFRAEVLSKGPLNGLGSSTVDTAAKEYNRLQDSKNTELDSRLASSYKIKKMRLSGEFSDEEILAEKKLLGMSTSTSTETSVGAYDALSMQIANETNSEVRERLMNQLIILDTHRQMKGQPIAIIQATINNLKASQQQDRKGSEKQEDFRDKMLSKFIDKTMAEPKSELDLLDKLTGIIEKMKKLEPESGGLKEITENVKAYKELGLIRDQKDTVEEMKLDVEKLRVDKEYEIRKEEIAADRARTESIGTIAGDLVSSAFSAVGATAGSQKKSEIPREKYIRDTLEAACVHPGCGGKILVTNSSETRNITCAKCGSNYQYDANQKKLFLLGEESSGPPVKQPPAETPPQQPSTPQSPGISDHPIV